MHSEYDFTLFLLPSHSYLVSILHLKHDEISFHFVAAFAFFRAMKLTLVKVFNIKFHIQNTTRFLSTLVTTFAFVFRRAIKFALVTFNIAVFTQCTTRFLSTLVITFTFSRAMKIILVKFFNIDFFS